MINAALVINLLPHKMNRLSTNLHHGSAQQHLINPEQNGTVILKSTFNSNSVREQPFILGDNRMTNTNIKTTSYPSHIKRWGGDRHFNS